MLEDRKQSSLIRRYERALAVTEDDSKLEKLLAAIPHKIEDRREAVRLEKAFKSKIIHTVYEGVPYKKVPNKESDEFFFGRKNPRDFPVIVYDLTVSGVEYNAFPNGVEYHIKKLKEDVTRD